MNELLTYIVKSVVVLLLLYAPYSLLLRKESFFRTNRFVLLSILALSLVLPLCNFSSLYLGNLESELIRTSISPLIFDDGEANVNHGVPLQMKKEVATDQSAEIETTMLAPELNATQEAKANIAGLAEILDSIYIIGFGLAVLVRLWQLVRMEILVQQGCLWKEKKDGVTIYCHTKDIAPCSWMNKIVISQKDYDSHRREILLHEKGHIACRHSFDILLLIAVQTIQWFNPFVYMFGASLRDVHEYEADDYVLRQGVSANEYQLLLLKKTVDSSSYAFANSFNHSTLKNRIIMMKKEKGNPWMRSKVLYILPLTLIALCAFASPEAKQNAIEEATSAVIADTVAVEQKTETVKATAPIENIIQNKAEETETKVVEPETTAIEEESDTKKIDMSDLLLVFEGKAVSKKEFKKLWKEHYNQATHIVYTDLKDMKNIIIDREYYKHGMIGVAPSRIKECKTAAINLPDLINEHKDAAGVIVVEKMEDVIGQESHPLYWYAWNRAVSNTVIEADTATNFVLSGTTTKGLRDVAYLINFEDEDGDINKKPTAVVLVKDGKFSYRTKLDKEVRARIRAVFEDGSLCEAYIEEQFIPGNVLHMLVMDNQYRYTNHTLPTPE